MRKFLNSAITATCIIATVISSLFAPQMKAQEMKYSNLRDGNGITVNVAVDDFSFESLTYKGEEMQEINISGINLPNDAGMPNLPRVSRYIAVPQGAEAKITVRNISTETIENVNLAPALEIQAENEEPSMDYKKNDKVYNTNAMYPAQIYELSEPTSVRGVDAVILGVTPFQYNPVTQQLVVVRSIDIDVEFIGGNNHYGEDRYRSRWFDPILQNIFLNYEALPKMDYSKLRDGEGCEYLIVIPNNDAWLPYAEALKTWRTEQGISTQIMSLADMGCSTTAQIKTFMHNAYNNWDIPPVAVLMMADHGTDLTRYIPAETVSHPSDGTCISDNQYADVTGDYLPEMAFARMVGSTVAEIAIISSKSLEYEQNPCMDAAYYNNPVTALGWQTERWFQLCSEVIGGYFRANDKNPVRINCIYSGTPGSSWSSNQNTTTVVNYFGPNGLNYIPATPTELGGWTGGTPAQIVTAMNTGAFIVQHRDHGLEDGWGEPAFRSSHVAQLTNVGKMSYVFSINCLTGMFNYSSKCFAENFILRQYNNENAGAVGILCPTEVSYSFVNDTYVWGVYDLFEPDFLPSFGPYAENSGNWMPGFANVAGKYFLAQSSWPYNSSSKQITYQMFTHHGDAFLRLYSEVPQTLTVAHPSTVIAGSTSVSISCNEGALIALTVDGEIIAVADATGSYQDITIPVLIPTTEIKVVCTKQNYLRYTGTITVVPAEGPYIIGQSWVVNDANGDGILKYGETATIDMTAKNVGVATATNVVMTLSSSSEYVTITDNTANFGTIVANATATVADAFAITISTSVPDNQNIPFEMTCTDGTNTWVSNMSVKAYRPILEYSSFTWPGLYTAGESLNITVTYSNEGGAPMDNVTGSIASTNQYVTVNTSSQSFGSINANGSAFATFNVTVSENIPTGEVINFTTSASGDNGVITAEGSFSIANSCNVIFNLADSYGDGWNGASLTVAFDDGSPSQSMTVSSGSSATYSIEINMETTVTVSFVSGSWNAECSFNIQYETGETIYASSGTPQAGVQCSFVCDCGYELPEDCNPPTNVIAESTDDAEIEVTWTAATYAVTYNIFRDDVMIETGFTGNSFIDNDVEIGETYCYTLVSICSTGESPSSNSSCATVSAFFQINASASPSNGGTITGTGTFEAGTTVTLTATANSGYEFTNWTENGSVVSTNATFSFTASEDRTLVANFNIISYTIAASANPTEGGTINGAGSYNYGSVVILLTTTNQGYEFANWTENGTVVANTPAYTFTATSNRTLMANFNLISYEITAESNPSEGGSISGTGIYNYNETASLTATPNTNYNFLNWTENGTVVSSEATYSFTVTENRALVANFQYFNAINNSNTLSANVYPNPTQNTVIIECENMTEINVFGTTGNLLMTANVSGNSYSLNLNSLTAGTFQVCITTTNGIIVKKIVKE